MIWKSVWRIESTGLLTEILLAIVAVLLASVGVSFSSPILFTIVGVALFLLIYRLRYKRL